MNNASRARQMDSPFLELSSPLTRYEVFKLVLLLPTVIPRVVVGVFVLIIIATINSIAIIGCNMEGPIAPWRRRICLISKELLIVVFYMLFFRMQVRGRENLKAAERLKSIIVFNHVSWLDAFVLFWLVSPSGVTLLRNSKIPIIKYATRALHTIYIQKNVSVISILQQRVNHPAYTTGFPIIAIAPEGTCSHGRCLLKFKTGTFTLGKPVCPILFTYTSRTLNPAWTNMNIYFHFVRLMCQLDNGLDVHILPPYVPSTKEVADPALYARNVRIVMAQTLGVPLVEQDQSDFLNLVKRGVYVAWDGKTVVGLD
jgi:lysophosphatidylcholine acyltransferase/lyso-PAF acetyltransferase